MSRPAKVSCRDVEQAVRRDFPPDQFANVMSILDDIKKIKEDELPGFQLNILSLSHGKLNLLHRNIDYWVNYVPQPTPKASRGMVERIVRRDFPAESFADVLAILDAYGKESWHNEQSRVQLAALKLANGNLERLRRMIEAANSDYRDILVAAEYPESHRTPFRLKSKPEQQKQIYARDWQQYKDWFEGK